MNHEIDHSYRECQALINMGWATNLCASVFHNLFLLLYFILLKFLDCNSVLLKSLS